MAESFKELKDGIVKVLAETTGAPVEAGLRGDNPALDDLDTIALSIDGVPVMLTYFEALRKDRAFVFTNFGSVAHLKPEQELEVLRRLMQINFIVFQGGAPTFARDPESGEVMLMSDIPLAVAVPEMVLLYMQEAAAQAREWRKTYFLDDARMRADAFAMATQAA